MLNAGYAFMLSTAAYHFVTGAAKFLKISKEYVTEGGEYGARKRKTRGRLVNLVAAVLAGVWIVGGLGVIGRGVGAAEPSAWEVKGWKEVYSNVPLVGSWL